ncbi:protein huluwa [Dunckerocampus dactyliophorus]|uniref:protein huluwa n=1 Tax=Dunckerocampus dactyliophorus TaxID=161453 RepID=UPI0024056934|nr:protein huluwa [Dunckerocampus dactyliophorus]
MSDPRQSTPPNLTEGYPVTNLTLVVLLLIPAVVVLLLLNCFFLGYKLLLLFKRNRQKREDTEEVLLHRVCRRSPDVEVFPTRRAYMSLSEPALPHPVTSSRASSMDRVGAEQRIRLLRPDGATGSGSQRAPSSIRASGAGRLDPASGSRSTNKAGWRHSAPVLPMQASDSETEVRLHLVPPNSPTETQHAVQAGRSSPYGMLTELSPGVMHIFDQVDMACEYIDPPSERSCLNTSAVQGSGLDSDFGASAGVSLRILSADSDGLSNGVLASALEWDYYDPCYVKQNNVPKHKHHRTALHSRQYWV